MACLSVSREDPLVTWLVLLVVAIGFEVAATSLLPAAGSGNAPAIVAVIVGYAIALTLLAVVAQTREVGFIYAMWSGIGTSLVAAVGVLALGESATPMKGLGLALVIVGLITLNLADPSH
jgi:small multidrug resistance pump